MRHLLVTLILLLSQVLQANTQLQQNYLIEHNYILLSDIVKSPTKDLKIYTISSNRHSKRVKTVELIKLLKKYGYKNFKSRHAYIQFTQKSPIQTQKIKDFLHKSYSDFYTQIKILNIIITPRSYMTSIPKEYSLEISPQSMLRSLGVIAIKTSDHKKIFFNYQVKATIPLLVTKSVLKKGDELSQLNIQKKSIMLTQFKALPVQKLKLATYEAKHRLKKDLVITKRDIVGLYLIKRGSNVNVSINNSNMTITFSAKAYTSGRLGESITLIGTNKKKIKAVVTGRNRAEMR